MAPVAAAAGASTIMSEEPNESGSASTAADRDEQVFAPSRTVLATPEDSDALLKAFEEVKRVATLDPPDFNERFQHVFARTAASPHGAQQRVSDLQAVVDAFQEHTSVRGAAGIGSAVHDSCAVGGGARAGASAAATYAREPVVD